VQERRCWLSKERFVEGMALVQALPGATALQMCVFAGYQRAGLSGGVLAGLGFIIPAFAIMLVLTALHSAYGALPFMRDAFYGLGPVVLGIFAVAVWRLGRNAIKDRFAILVALAAIAALALSPIGPAGTFLLAGCIGVAAHHSLRAGVVSGAVVVALLAAEHLAASWLGGPSIGPGPASNGVWDIGVFFFKVGALTFGGGLTIIAFIQDQVVNQLHWISAEEFLEGLAIGQVTPGPVIMLAAFVGLQGRGPSRARRSQPGRSSFRPLCCCCRSCRGFERFRALKWMRAAMRGVGPAVVGAIGLSVVHLAPTRGARRLRRRGACRHHRDPPAVETARDPGRARRRDPRRPCALALHLAERGGRTCATQDERCCSSKAPRSGGCSHPRSAWLPSSTPSACSAKGRCRRRRSWPCMRSREVSTSRPAC
jgi:chromate transporter